MANIELAKKCKYPIHLGVTESGPEQAGIVKSCIALIPLLNMGIGNTIRISVNGDHKEEIKIDVGAMALMKQLLDESNDITDHEAERLEGNE